MRAWASVRRYAAHDDPLTATANLIALVVAWNQPFYPLYVYWGVSETWQPALWSFLSTPFFAAVPLVSRWNATAGRAMLPVVGIANTMLCTAVFGSASGTEIFLIPCALIPCLLFRRGEWAIRLLLTALPFAIFLAFHRHYGAPVHLYSGSEYAAFLSLNAISAGTLTVFTGYLATSAIRN